MVNKLTNSQRNFFLNMSGFVTACLFFTTGIGSYRIFVVYALHCLIRALNTEQKYIAFFLPAYIATLYLDVTSGPIFTTTKPYFLILFLIAFVVADSLLHTLFKKIISNATENQFFIECPSCHFNNIHLVDACSNCSYKKGNQLAPSAQMISSGVIGDVMPPGLLNLLTLDENEGILLHKKLTRNIAKFKNEVRQSRKHFVITTLNVIILDYFSFHMRIPKSWRERDLIPLSEIVTVEVRLKEFYLARRPFLIIRTTRSDVYEIVFPTVARYGAVINEIVATIKRENSQVKTVIEMNQSEKINLQRSSL